MPTGEKIKELRKKRGLTQKQLGDLCGMADSAIRRYENGRANPKIETLQKIADALDVKVIKSNDEFDLVDADTSVITEKNITLETLENHPRLEKILEEYAQEYVKNSQNIVDSSPFPFDCNTFNAADRYSKIDFYNFLFDRIDIRTINGEEYYNLYLSIPDVKDEANRDLQLRTNYSKLNALGKQEAIKRIEELTQIEKYTR